MVEWRLYKKEVRTLCDESKINLHSLLEQWTLDDNKYITSWQWFISCDLRTLYYIDHGVWWKYTRLCKRTRTRKHIVFNIYIKPVSQCPCWYHVCITSLISSYPTHLHIEATGLDVPPGPSEPPLELLK